MNGRAIDDTTHFTRTHTHTHPIPRTRTLRTRTPCACHLRPTAPPPTPSAFLLPHLVGGCSRDRVLVCLNVLRDGRLPLAVAYRTSGACGPRYCTRGTRAASTSALRGLSTSWTGRTVAQTPHAHSKIRTLILRAPPSRRCFLALLFTYTRTFCRA